MTRNKTVVIVFGNVVDQVLCRLYKPLVLDLKSHSFLGHIKKGRRVKNKLWKLLFLVFIEISTFEILLKVE